MPLSSKQRRELIASSHHIKPCATIAADALTASVVAHVRKCLETRPLAKIRILADTGPACDAAAAELAAAVPCEVVKRIGRAVLFYQSATDDRSPETRTAQF